MRKKSIADLETLYTKVNQKSVFSPCPNQLFVTPRNVACQALLTMEFSRQKYWSELS